MSFKENLYKAEDESFKIGKREGIRESIEIVVPIAEQMLRELGLTEEEIQEVISSIRAQGEKEIEAMNLSEG